MTSPIWMLPICVLEKQCRQSCTSINCRTGCTYRKGTATAALDERLQRSFRPNVQLPWLAPPSPIVPEGSQRRGPVLSDNGTGPLFQHAQ